MLAGLVVSGLLAGCTSSGSNTRGTMMGGPVGSGSQSGMLAGPGGSGTLGSMMGGPAGYHFPALSCAVPTSLPGTTVIVTLADMGMSQMMGGDAPVGGVMMLQATPQVVAAGTVSLVAENRGWRTHELVVLPLGQSGAAGQRVPGADGKVSESGSLGEASASCAAGSGEGIDSAAVGWKALQLSPGRYELVCNLKNHYANGMYQELDVR